MTAQRGDWWRHSFDDEYYRLHEPLFSEEQSRHDVAAIIDLLGVPANARILDAPCGWGRHTQLFAAGGYRAFGLDLSPALLARARSRKRFPALSAADIRHLPFADGSFDVVLNVFTSLGIFHSDRDEVRMLREARRVLTSAGRFLLETMHRDDVVRHYAVRDRWKLPDGTRVSARRSFDPVTGLSHELWQWRRGVERGEREHVLRLRTATEVDVLMQKAGFRELQYFGDWDGSPLTHRSPRLIVTASAT